MSGEINKLVAAMNRHKLTQEELKTHVVYFPDTGNFEWVQSKYGSFPSLFLDHINRDKTDNRLCNLREVTPEENMQNRIMKLGKTGIQGVHTRNNKTFFVRLHSSGKSNYFGTFKCKELAEFVYQEAARLFHTCNPNT